MVYIIFSIIGLVAILLVPKSWQPKKQIVSVCLIIVVGGILFLIVDSLLLDSGVISKGSESKISWMEIGLYFAMLLGMSTKYLYDAIGDKNIKKLKFNKFQFFKPFLISPVIFAGVYGMIPQNTATLLLFIFSYQNGFFWQSMLNREA